MIRDQVQKNENGVNVLVETKNSSGRHYCHLNEDVEIIKTLDNNEIIELWENRKDNDKLKLAKNWIKQQDNYAISNCVDETLNINYSSIVEFSIK